MNPRTETIPGLRKPDTAERAWIADMWKEELQQGYSPNAGKLIRYVGVFLICVGVVNFVRGSGGLVGMLMLLLLAAGCIALSKVGTKSSRDHKDRITAVENGDYLVVQAVSTKIDSSYRGNRPIGCVKAALSNGESINGLFRIPYACAEPLLKQGIHNVPVLLIVFSCDPEILAIPVKK